MKKFIVIGLGNFGLNLSRILTENGCEVLGLDSNKSMVQRAKDMITQTVIGDATDKSVLSSLPIKDFDGAVVSIGQELAASILISLYLKEIGIKRIIVRAISEDHEKILKMQGVSDIIFPERDMAVRIGKLLSMKNVLDYLPLTQDYSIMEVNPPKSFQGRTIRELQIGSTFSCQILGIKYKTDGSDKLNGISSSSTDNTKIAPLADDVIPPNSILIVLGKQRDIERIQNTE